MSDVAALMDEFCPGQRTLTKTQAEGCFCLEGPHGWCLDTLEHEERPNPSGFRNAAPMRIFQAHDVARLALQVHGSSSLAAARAELRRLRADAQAEQERRAQVKAEMEARSRARADAAVAHTPERRLCKQLGVDPDGELCKTKALETFKLTPCQLMRLTAREKVGVAGALACPARPSGRACLPLRSPHARPWPPLPPPVLLLRSPTRATLALPG